MTIHRWRQAFLLGPVFRHASPTARYHFALQIGRGSWGIARSISTRRRGDDAGGKGKSEDTHARLPPLALAPLRDIALLCGRNSSGTKSVLRADLEAAMDEEDAAKRKTTAPAALARRILSIDMGVRNLAYCVLHVSGSEVPKLVAWERLSLIGEKPSKKGAEEETAKTPALAFSPLAMAAVAARLIKDRLLPLAPTHVLIERQRFRSGGAAAVLEWTVRVNSLEAMLHGIFAYRQLEKPDTARGGASGDSVQAVQAVSPRRVSQFLLRGDIGSSGGGKSRPGAAPLPEKTAKEKDIKDVKEAFVAGTLRPQDSSQIQKPLLTYDEGVRGMVDAYLLRWDAKQNRLRTKGAAATSKAPPSKSPVETHMALSKIDDLADCIAQGLIWLEWERNKATLRQRGAEALLADKQLPG